MQLIIGVRVKLSVLIKQALKRVICAFREKQHGLACSAFARNPVRECVLRACLDRPYFTVCSQEQGEARLLFVPPLWCVNRFLVQLALVGHWLFLSPSITAALCKHYLQVEVCPAIFHWHSSVKG